MDEALDLGDTKTFKDLSVTYESLRKSGKFTEAQKQEEERREIDSIGELVAFVEERVGQFLVIKTLLNIRKIK